MIADRQIFDGLAQRQIDLVRRTVAYCECTVAPQIRADQRLMSGVRRIQPLPYTSSVIQMAKDVQMAVVRQMEAHEIWKKRLQEWINSVIKAVTDFVHNPQPTEMIRFLEGIESYSYWHQDAKDYFQDEYPLLVERAAGRNWCDPTPFSDAESREREDLIHTLIIRYFSMPLDDYDIILEGLYLLAKCGDKDAFLDGLPWKTRNFVGIPFRHRMRECYSLYCEASLYCVANLDRWCHNF